jgi:NTP pyrophosphatase (non-canonical NTP hydrolase)
MEMADILFVIICMANREGIDLQAAFDRMMTKVEMRDRDRWTRKEGQKGERRKDGKTERR